MCKEKAASLWLEVEMLGTAATWMGILGFKKSQQVGMRAEIYRLENHRF